MQKASSISVLTCALLCASSALADETPVPSAAATLPTDAQLLTAIPSNYDWSAAPIDDVEFLDNSALARIKRLEELSFLTLSETRGTRLFLGVNGDGLVGLHFRIK